MEALMGLLIIVGGILLIFGAFMLIAILFSAITGDSDKEFNYKYNEYRDKVDMEFQPWRKPGWKPKDAWMVNDKDNEK